jgi:MFS family permease
MSGTMPASPAHREGLFSPRHRGLTVGLVLVITLVAFEALAVSTIMPIVARELGGLELYGWVFTAFFLGSILGIVVVGGAIDRRGLAAPLVLGLGLFAIGLVVGGLAPSMPILVVGRFLQGLGAGSIPPIAYVAIARSLPEAVRPRMFAVLSTAWVLPGVLGPALAGFIGETLGWRIVFLGLLPLIVFAGAITMPAIRAVSAPSAAVDAEARAAASLRRRGPLAVRVTLGTALLMAGLTTGEPVPLVVLVVIGLVVGYGPLIRLTPRGTLRAARGLPAAVLIRGIATFAFFGVDAYVALTLVEWRGQTATQAGIALTAATVSWTAGAWIQARGSDRWGPDRFVRLGLFVAVIGLGLFGVVLIPTVPEWVAIPTFLVAGLGMGLAYAPLSLIVLREAAPGEQGFASSALSLTDALGTALGTGVTGAIVAVAVRGTGEPALGLAGGFAVAVAVGLLGLALSGRLRVHPGERPAPVVLPAGQGDAPPQVDASPLPGRAVDG